jgi:hypothetical protein
LKEIKEETQMDEIAFNTNEGARKKVFEYLKDKLIEQGCLEESIMITVKKIPSPMCCKQLLLTAVGQKDD